MELKFKGDQSASIEIIRQSSVYSGMLAGVPSEKMNLRIIERAVEEANYKLFSSDVRKVKVALVNPIVEIHENDLGNGKIVKYPVLPSYLNIILAVDIFNERQAVIVLFTKEIVNMQEILDKVKDLNWTEISETFCW